MARTHLELILILSSATGVFPSYRNVTGNQTGEGLFNGDDAQDPGVSSPVVSSALVIGVCLAIGGNLFISVAMNIQKCALTNIQNKREAMGLEPVGHHDYLTSWLWWLGIAVMVFGEGGNFMAYGFGPASVIAPLGTATVVANAYIARCLGEKLRCKDVLGTIIIVIGAVMIIIFSTQNDRRLTPAFIIHRLIAWPFLVYLAVEVILFVLVVYLKNVHGYKHVILFILPAALLGSLTVLGAKATSNVIALSIEGQPVYLSSPIFYIMILTVIITGVLQIRYVTRAMQEYDASVVVPVFFVFFTLSAILVGVFFYGEFSGLNFIRICMFLFGCMCSFIGVFMITHGRTPQEEATEETAKTEDPDPRISKNCNGPSPLMPPPTSLHFVQPHRQGSPDGEESPTDSEGPEIEMQDMSNTLRDQVKWPLLDKSTFSLQNVKGHGTFPDQ